MDEIKLEEELKYKESLEQKIRDQAYRLTEFPLLKSQIKEMKILLAHKDEEIMEINRKYDELLNTYKKKYETILQPNNTKMIDFPSIERITNEKMREAYSNLYQNYHHLSKEKEDIMKSYRSEILISEEQRNEIEILKRTIENTLAKLDTKSNLDEIINVNRLRKEISNLKKELSSANMQMSELKIEMNEFKFKKSKINQTLESGLNDLEYAKDKIRMLENEKDELVYKLNQSQEEIQRSKNDFNVLIDEFNKIKEKNSNYEKSVQELIKENQFLNLKNKDFFETLSELKVKDQESIIREKENEIVNSQKQLKFLESKLNELNQIKDQYDKLTLKNSEISKKLIELEEKNEDLKNSNNYLEKVKKMISDDYDALKENIDKDLNQRDSEISELYENFKILKEKLEMTENQLINIKNEKEELTNLLNEKDEYIKSITLKEEDLNFKYTEFNKLQMTLDDSRRELESEINFLKNLIEKKNKSIMELNENNELKTKQYKNLTKEMDSLIQKLSIYEKSKDCDINVKYNYENKINELIEENDILLKNIENKKQLEYMLSGIKEIIENCISTGNTLVKTISHKNLYPNLKLINTETDFVEKISDFKNWFKIFCLEFEKSTFLQTERRNKDNFDDTNQDNILQLNKFLQNENDLLKNKIEILSRNIENNEILKKEVDHLTNEIRTIKESCTYKLNNVIERQRKERSKAKKENENESEMKISGSKYEIPNNYERNITFDSVKNKQPNSRKGSLTKNGSKDPSKLKISHLKYF